MRHQTDVPWIAGVFQGVAAGLLATLPMTLAMAVMQRYLPRTQRYALPPRQITRRVLDRMGLKKHRKEPEQTALTGIAHFGYGAAMGGALAALARMLPLPSVLSGVAYALLVWGVSYQGWIPALEIMPPATRHPARRNALMIVAHVVWGSAAGWLLGRMRQSGER